MSIGSRDWSGFTSEFFQLNTHDTWNNPLKSESPTSFLMDKVVMNQNTIANIKCHSTTK